MFCLIVAVSATCPHHQCKPNSACDPVPSSLFNLSQRIAKLESLKNTLENFSTKRKEKKEKKNLRSALVKVLRLWS